MSFGAHDDGVEDITGHPVKPEWLALHAAGTEVVLSDSAFEIPTNDAICVAWHEAMHIHCLVHRVLFWEGVCFLNNPTSTSRRRWVFQVYIGTASMYDGRNRRLITVVEFRNLPTTRKGVDSFVSEMYAHAQRADALGGAIKENTPPRIYDAIICALARSLFTHIILQRGY